MPKTTGVAGICREVRRLIAAGEFTDDQIATLAGCPISTVRSVKARLNRPGRAAFVDGQIGALERRMASLERLVSTVLGRIATLEVRTVRTRKSGVPKSAQPATRSR